MPKNFGYTTVATAPSPATSGTSITVATGHGSRFEIGDRIVRTPPGATVADLPTVGELLDISNIVGDVLTVVRARESTTAQAIAIGDELRTVITAGLFAGKEPLQSGGEVLTWDFQMSDGSDLTTGAGVPRTCRFNGTIASWRVLIISGTGSITFDLRKDTYANFPPSASIVASAPPATSSAVKAESSTLTGWTTALTAGDVIVPHITAGGTGIKKATLELIINRS